MDFKRTDDERHLAVRILQVAAQPQLRQHVAVHHRSSTGTFRQFGLARARSASWLSLVISLGIASSW
jgi:hypothetical protein